MIGNMKRPVLCVMSEIPGLASLVKESCGHLMSRVISIEPGKVREREAELRQAEILVTEPHTAQHWLYGLPNLKFVQGTWAGVERVMNVVRPGDFPSVVYCRYGGRFGVAMSEYVAASIINYERNMRAAYQAQAQSHWSSDLQEHIWYTTRSLDLMTVGILGLGDIGKRVAKVLKTFGMQVWGLTTTIPEVKSPYVDHYRTTENLDEVLSNCDYVCSVLPSTPKTRGLLDGDALKACAAKRAVLINVGRGDVCSEAAICKAIKNGWLRGAILDVLPEEPLPTTSPLWLLPNVTITPHISAVSLPSELIDLISKNINHYVTGSPLLYVLDWHKGY